MFFTCCGFLAVFVCVGTNSVPTGNSYPFVTVTDRILYTYFKPKYCVKAGG